MILAYILCLIGCFGIGLAMADGFSRRIGVAIAGWSALNLLAIMAAQ